MKGVSDSTHLDLFSYLYHRLRHNCASETTFRSSYCRFLRTTATRTRASCRVGQATQSFAEYVQAHLVADIVYIPVSQPTDLSIPVLEVLAIQSYMNLDGAPYKVDPLLFRRAGLSEMSLDAQSPYSRADQHQVAPLFKADPTSLPRTNPILLAYADDVFNRLQRAQKHYHEHAYQRKKVESSGSWSDTPETDLLSVAQKCSCYVQAQPETSVVHSDRVRMIYHGYGSPRGPQLDQSCHRGVGNQQTAFRA
jgi:hypothetical protein